jgi:hypothetical protein
MSPDEFLEKSLAVHDALSRPVEDEVVTILKVMSDVAELFQSDEAEYTPGQQKQLEVLENDVHMIAVKPVSLIHAKRKTVDRKIDPAAEKGLWMVFRHALRTMLGKIKVVEPPAEETPAPESAEGSEPEAVFPADQPPDVESDAPPDSKRRRKK